MSELIVYGVELSQPCRTVTWLLRNHGVPFKLQPTNPGSNKPHGSRSEKYLDELYIAGTVPVLKDGDVVVPESHAIIVYLAEKFGWDEVFPTGKGNEAKRAEINRWL
jgi:glutathione S-transferase